MGKIWLEERVVDGKWLFVVLDNLEGDIKVRFEGTKSHCLQFVAGCTAPGAWATA
jgi:hypothetical protein